MTITSFPLVEPAEPPSIEEPRTQTSPRRSGGWLRRLQQRIRLAMFGDDEALQIENATDQPWLLYHNYHQLGLIDPTETRTFHLTKHGTLNVRPSLSSADVEYLMLPLTTHTHRIRIYRRTIAQNLEVYDMRVL